VILSLCVAASSSCDSGSLDAVDVFIGSSGPGFGYGSVSPAAQVPYGALRIGPDTTSSPANIEFRHFSGYNYYDTMIRGFSHTRLVGAGVSDLGTFGVMPVRNLTTDALSSTESTWWSTFRKETEVARPGYYSVFLDLPSASAEMVAVSEFAGIHKYNFSSGPGEDQLGVVVDICHAAALLQTDAPQCLDAGLEVDPSLSSFTGRVLIDGSLSHGIWVYIYGKLEGTGLSGWTICNGNKSASVCDSTSLEAESQDGRLYALASLTGGHAVEMRVGISFISEEQARINLEAAMSEFSASSSDQLFDAALERTTSVWCDTLDRFRVGIDVSTIDREDLLTQLHTAHYRTLMSPTVYSEIGGVYLGMDKKVHSVSEDRGISWDSKDLTTAYFSDLSLWDTFRAMLPWQLLATKDLGIGILRSIEDMVKTTGAFPRWVLGSTESGCMIGMHGAAAVLEGLLKGYDDYFNVTEIQAAMLEQATVPGAPNGRNSVEFYLEHGYVPTESSDIAASLTLSYAFDDFLLAGVSKYTEDFSVAEEAQSRSKNYKNIWSPLRELMCSKSEAGELHCPLDPIGPQSWNMYKEGDAFHWLYFVPHDMQGLIDLFPTKNHFLSSLETFFEKHVESHDHIGSFLPNPYFWAGNEVCHATLWFFNLLDCTRSQYWSRKIIPMHFSATPEGLPGNDDYGSMSSFLLFTSLGLFPQAGTDRYFIGSPSISSSSLVLRSVDGPDAVLKITAYNNTDENVYVQRLIIGDEEYKSPVIEHDILFQHALNGNTLEFYMGPDASSGLCSEY